MTYTTFQGVIATNHYYEAGASMATCRDAVQPANELFGGDPLKGLLYIMANGYAIDVGSNLIGEAKKQARLEWNRRRAESESVWIREKYDV